MGMWFGLMRLDLGIGSGLDGVGEEVASGVSFCCGCLVGGNLFIGDAPFFVQRHMHCPELPVRKKANLTLPQMRGARREILAAVFLLTVDQSQK